VKFKTQLFSIKFLSFRSLGETSRNVYKENGVLIESIRIYKQEFDVLQKTKEQLTKLISNASGNKELNEILIKEKIEQVQKQNNTIKEVNIKKKFSIKYFISFLKY